MWCFDPAKNELSSKGAYSIERVVVTSCEVLAVL